MVAFVKSVPVLPAADLDSSLAWWTEICGFTIAFRHGDYAGISRDDASLHICGMSDPALARTVGDQTMIRFVVEDVEALYAEYQLRGGKVHPNGPLQTKPWGTKEFGALGPNGVCVAFVG
jgi:catechol 2,3-dioxygenase-like lactoylglutathione lyase family enzyme